MLDAINVYIDNHPFIIDIIKVCLLPTLLFTLNWLLDLDIARSTVKYLSFLNFIVARTTFRDKPISISGTWEQRWEFDIKNSTTATEEQKLQYSNDLYQSKSITKIRQLGRFCYAEFTSNNDTETYIFWGKIEGKYVYGQWYDKKTDRKNNLGYFGSFQLKIKKESEMFGLWIGHAENDSKINTGDWYWNKKKEQNILEKITNYINIKKTA